MRNATILDSNNMAIKEGDTKDIFRLGLSYEDGSVPDLTNAEVKLYIANENFVVLIKDMAVEGNGVVSFTLTKDDVTGCGELDLEIVVTYGDGRIETFPDTKYLCLKVTPSLSSRSSEEFPTQITIFNKVTELEEFKNSITLATVEEANQWWEET